MNQTDRRDGIAFGAIVAFAIATYTSAAHLVPALEPLRPALASALVAFAALLIGRTATRRSLTPDGWRGFALLGLGGWALLSTRWSFEPAVTRETARELIKLVAIYLTAVNVITSRRRLAFLCGAIVVSSLAPSLGAIGRWRDGLSLVDGFRATWAGVYEDPNHLAMILVAIAPLTVFFAFSARSIAFRIVSLAALIFAVTAIVLTHSRGGALGLALALGVWASLGKKKLRSLALTGAVLIGVAIFAPSTFWERTETLGAVEQDVSAMGRVWAWEVTTKIGRDRPITGVGLGAFRFAWPTYAPREARATPLVAHNIFFSVLGELGLIGLVLLLLFVGNAMAGALRAFQKARAGALPAAGETVPGDEAKCPNRPGTRPPPRTRAADQAMASPAPPNIGASVAASSGVKAGAPSLPAPGGGPPKASLEALLDRPQPAEAKEGAPLRDLSRALIAGGAGFLLCDLFSGYFISAHFFFFWALLAACARLNAAHDPR